MTVLQYQNNHQRLTLFDRQQNSEFRGELVLATSIVPVVIKPPRKLVKKVKRPAQSRQKLTPFQLLERRQKEKINGIDVVVEEIVEEVESLGWLDRLFGSFSDFRKTELLNWINRRLTISPSIGRVLATFCLGLSLLGFSYVLAPLVASEIHFRFSQPDVVSAAKVVRSILPAPSETPSATIAPIDWADFSISIPKINVQSPIVANVDPGSSEDYQKVLSENGVAHAKGSYVPGERGPMVLFAHSTDTVANILRFNAKFYAAKELEIGDEIDIEFNHKQYQYFVDSKKIVNPQDIDTIRSSNADLVLSTCYPPGTSWQRLIIFAKLAS